MLTKLPPVAKSLLTYCAKCGGEKYHTVLAHLDHDSAKIVCDICKKKSTFRLSQQNRVTPHTPRVRKSYSDNEGIAAAKQNEAFEKMMQDFGNTPEKTYSIQSRYQVNDKIVHPKFQVGFVLKVMDDRIEVLFADQVRQLICARSV